jgi:hypothetical protein
VNDVSEERIASIFRVENPRARNKREQMAQGGFSITDFSAHTGFSFADFPTLNIDAICSSETSVHATYTRRHIPGDGILNWDWINLYF